ncbi:MAG: cytochrome P450 [Xenococcaceae cyanobacterium MO_234.B1]|nr:cytochrome P450 [Xenococcaceae cyanobacterium MO_234.B1]
MEQIPTVQSTSGLLRTIRQINGVLRPLNFMEERNRKYGDFYQITFKNAPPTVMTSNPQAIEDIFTASPDTFEVGKGNQGLNFLVGDNSLLLLDGKVHKNRRRLLMPSFHGESLQECSHKIVSITRKVCDGWQLNESFKVRPYMQEITLRVILNVVFGIDSGEKYERLRVLLTKLLETFNNPLSSLLIFFPTLRKDWGKFSPWGRFLLLKEEIRKLIYQEIKERRDLLASGKSERRDIFSLLLLAKDENGKGMTDEELHDELITLLFAGHETTASGLAWLFYWIHSLPEVQEKLRFELDSLGANPDYREINNLPYLDAVISETLRIYPIAAGTFGRILTKPMSVMGYDFDPKTWLMISIYSLHHREDLYPNSKQFKPERFLQTSYSPYEYIPFGGGNRRCLGSALALLEMKLVTATVLPRFQLELTSKRPMLPVRRGLTLAPPASFKMVVKNKIT